MALPSCIFLFLAEINLLPEAHPPAPSSVRTGAVLAFKNCALKQAESKGWESKVLKG